MGVEAISEGSISLPIEDSPMALDHFGPIFILGCPRSGTTFLSRCIAAFPDIEEFVGILAPPRIMHFLGECRDDQVAEQVLLSLRDTFWNSFWRRRFYRDERLVQLLRQNIDVSHFLALPKLDGALFCYKEPFLCFAASRFAEHFPNSKFLHIIRDGRDNADSLDRTYPHALSDEVLRSDVLSLNKNSEIGAWTNVDGLNIPNWVPKGETATFASLSKYERNVLMWREMTIRARDLRTQLGGDRYLELRYEDLVSDPVKHGDAIGAFLGREVTPQVVKRLNKAFKNSTGISKRNQDAQKLERTKALAGKLLSELGYE